MSAWLYLFLAHLIADFILQPYELVRLKRRPVGLTIHSLIHALIMILLAAPVLPRWWAIIPAVIVAHYVVDRMKVVHGPERGPLSLAAFLLDQAAHMVILAGAVVAAGLPLGRDVFYRSAALTGIFYYAVPYVAATFAGAILLYQIAVALETRPNPEELLQPRPRVGGMLARLVALTVVLFLSPLWWWTSVLSFLPQAGVNHRQPRRWLETASALGYAVGLGLLFR